MMPLTINGMLTNGDTATWVLFKKSMLQTAQASEA